MKLWSLLTGIPMSRPPILAPPHEELQIMETCARLTRGIDTGDLEEVAIALMRAFRPPHSYEFKNIALLIGCKQSDFVLWVLGQRPATNEVALAVKTWIKEIHFIQSCDCVRVKQGGAAEDESVLFLVPPRATIGQFKRCIQESKQFRHVPRDSMLSLLVRGKEIGSNPQAPWFNVSRDARWEPDQGIFVDVEYIY